MAVLIIGIVVAWMLFSAFLVTMACMSSSRISRIEEPMKRTRALAKSRRMRTLPQVQPGVVSASAES